MAIPLFLGSISAPWRMMIIYVSMISPVLFLRALTWFLKTGQLGFFNKKPNRGHRLGPALQEPTPQRPFHGTKPAHANIMCRFAASGAA